MREENTYKKAWEDGLKMVITVAPAVIFTIATAVLTIWSIEQLRMHLPTRTVTIEVAKQ